MMKTIFITGANRGIGFEFVKQYLNLGCHVIATYRNIKNSEALLELAEKTKELVVHQLDVTDEVSIQKLAGELQNIPIDIFINNAGIAGESGVVIGNFNVDNFVNVFKTNTVAPLKVIEALLPNIKSSHLKSIIVISSRMGSIQENESGRSYAYRASKAALNAVMKSAAIDLAKDNIAVVMLHPGSVKTDMGGENALIDVTDSVNGLIKVISQVDMSNSGHFYNYKGEEIAW